MNIDLQQMLDEYSAEIRQATVKLIVLQMKMDIAEIKRCASTLKNMK